MSRPRGNRIANATQRVLVLLVFVVMAAMVWAAHSGRYDRQVNQVATWLHQHYAALMH
jgi:hypothetical protein